jgi:hypothetical protein
MTVGVDWFSFSAEHKGCDYCVSLWDAARQELYTGERSFVPEGDHRAEGFVVQYCGGVAEGTGREDQPRAEARGKRAAGLHMTEICLNHASHSRDRSGDMRRLRAFLQKIVMWVAANVTPSRVSFVKE